MWGVRSAAALVGWDGEVGVWYWVGALLEEGRGTGEGGTDAEFEGSVFV